MVLLDCGFNFFTQIMLYSHYKGFTSRVGAGWVILSIFFLHIDAVKTWIFSFTKFHPF